MNALGFHAASFLVGGLLFLISGFAIAVRAESTLASALRHRFLALAGFAVLRGVYEWVSLFNLINPGAVNTNWSMTLAALSYFPLYGFAFESIRRGQWISRGAVAATAIGWGVALATLTDPTMLKAFMQLGIALPASLAAAFGFLTIKSLRAQEGKLDTSLVVGGICFLLYGAMQLPNSHVLFSPASILNEPYFELALNLSSYVSRTVVAVLLFVVILTLLDRFDLALWLQERSKADALNSALAASEAELSDVRRIGKIGSWVWDIASDKLTCSDQVYSILGLEGGRVGATYAAFLECVHPNDRKLVEERARRAVEEHAPYDIEHRIVLPSGQVRHVSEQGKLEFRSSGQPLHMRGTIRDITEEKTSKEALEESQGALAGILTVAEEAVILADHDLCITLFSRGAQRIFGYKDHEATGLHIETLLSERYRGPYRDHIQNFAEASETSLQTAARQEVVGLRKSGEEFPAVVALSRFPTSKGYLYAIILRDIGPEKAAHEELVMARLAAESANRTKSAFLANMSHELRTPLNAIIGFSETIQLQPLGPVGSPKYIEYVADIHEAGCHLLNIVNDILDLAKIEAGKADLQEQRVDIAEVVRSCTLMVRHRAREVGLTLTEDISDTLAPLYADQKKLTQILLNLLSNAVKFTPKGGKVAVKAWSRPDTGVVIQVVDTGIGIARKDIPAALSPFKQVDMELSRKFEGTGLGLPLSKSLVELHGGSLDLQSEVGVGTTVTVRFPAERIVRQAATRY